MPFKTKLTPNWQIDWGKKYELMGYTLRENRAVKVFDLKKFVAKIKEEQGQPIGAPGMMGGMMPGMMGGLPNPFMSQPGPMPGMGNKSGIMPTSLDDYVKRLDEKIAELEREEAEEKARMEKERKETASKEKKIEESISKVDEKITKTEEDIQKQITEILEHKPEAVNSNKFVLPEEKEETIESSTQQPTYETIEKPKINVDVDSVVVNNKPVKEEDFFDDFFGTEDE
jgi:flagellar biosynthesis GTPase FlhF